VKKFEFGVAFCEKGAILKIQTQKLTGGNQNEEDSEVQEGFYTY